MLLLHVTTQIPGRKNDDLLARKATALFPTFLIMDPKGGVLSKQAGALDIARLSRMSDTAKKRWDAYVALKKRAASGDEKAATKCAVWELELGHVTLADFRKRFPDLSKIDEDLRDSVLGVWGDQVQRAAFAKFRKFIGRDRGKMPEGAKLVAPMVFEAAKHGAEPTGEDERRSWYWILGAGGEQLGNAEMLKLAIAGLEDEAESDARIETMVAGWTKKLEELGGKDGEKEDEEDEDEDDEDDGM